MEKHINEFKDYIEEKLKDEHELNEYNDVLLLEYNDDAAIHIIRAKIYSICQMMDMEYMDKEYSGQFHNALALGDYERAYEVMKYIFFHFFFALTISWDSMPKKLNRHILIPARSSIGDVIYATLAAFRTMGYHLAELNATGGFRFYPANLMDGDYEGECADAYPSCLLYELRNPRVLYDFGEGYEFKISMRKPKLLNDDDCWCSVIAESGHGYGIIEDERYALESFFECGKYYYGEGEEELDIDIDYNEINLEDLQNSIESDYQLTRDAYLFGIDGGADEDDFDIEQ